MRIAWQRKWSYPPSLLSLLVDEAFRERHGDMAGVRGRIPFPYSRRELTCRDCRPREMFRYGTRRIRRHLSCTALGLKCGQNQMGNEKEWSLRRPKKEREHFPFTKKDGRWSIVVNSRAMLPSPGGSQRRPEGFHPVLHRSLPRFLAKQIGYTQR